MEEDSKEYKKLITASKSMLLEFKTQKEVSQYLVSNGIEEQEAKLIARSTYIDIEYEIKRKKKKIKEEKEYHGFGGPIRRTAIGLLLVSVIIMLVLSAGYHPILILFFAYGIAQVIIGIKLLSRGKRKANQEILDDFE